MQTQDTARKQVQGLRRAQTNHLVSPEQLASLKATVNEIAEGHVEVRPVSYCGPGSAGARGAYAVVHNGGICAIVERTGSVS